MYLYILETQRDHGTPEYEIVTEKQHHLATCGETLKSFRREGGKETATRCYTSHGYVVTKLRSTSPHGSVTVRKYVPIEKRPKTEAQDKLLNLILETHGLNWFKREPSHSPKVMNSLIRLGLISYNPKIRKYIIGVHQ